MSLLSRLFGGGSTPKAGAEPLDHNGYTITPAPIREGNSYRISARIEKDIGGQIRTHTLIRADTMDDHETAVNASTAKAKMLIDEQGDRLFD
jgi:hypothetical protein